MSVQVTRVLFFKNLNFALDVEEKMVYGRKKCVININYEKLTIESLDFDDFVFPLEELLKNEIYVDMLTDDEVYFINEEVLV